MGTFLFTVKNHSTATESLFIFLSKMGNRGVHTETSGNGNSNDIVIKWILCPIVTAMAMALK